MRLTAPYLENVTIKFQKNKLHVMIYKNLQSSIRKLTKFGYEVLPLSTVVNGSDWIYDNKISKTMCACEKKLPPKTTKSKTSILLV